jgi:intraflagellar transport protein 140
LQRKLNQNSEEGLKDLQQLLQVENIETAIRVGDLYSLIIEFNANKQRWKQAYAVLQEMRASIPESSIKFYVNPNLLIAIHRELNIEYNEASSSSRRDNVKQHQQQSDYNDDIRDNVDFGTYDD